MPPASIRKIVVLAAYALGGGGRTAGPRAPVRLAEWEALSWAVPRGAGARVLTGAGLTPGVRETMARHPDWPLRVRPGNAQRFAALDAKGAA